MGADRIKCAMSVGVFAWPHALTAGIGQWEASHRRALAQLWLVVRNVRQATSNEEGDGCYSEVQNALQLDEEFNAFN